MMGGSDMQFCLRWNNFGTTMTAALHSLHEGGDFVDVTLAADGMQLKAHKLVLSACSPYFRDILRNNPCQHPVIILREVPIEDLEAVLAFMYEGQVNVSQTRLHTFMKLAEVLQVRGLTDAQTAWTHMDKDSYPTNLLASENGISVRFFTGTLSVPCTAIKIKTSSVSSPVVSTFACNINEDESDYEDFNLLTFHKPIPSYISTNFKAEPSFHREGKIQLNNSLVALTFSEGHSDNIDKFFGPRTMDSISEVSFEAAQTIYCEDRRLPDSSQGLYLTLSKAPINFDRLQNLKDQLPNVFPPEVCTKIAISLRDSSMHKSTSPRTHCPTEPPFLHGQKQNQKNNYTPIEISFRKLPNRPKICPMQTVQARFRTHDSPSPPPKRRKSSPARLRNSPKPADEEEENTDAQSDTKRDIRNMLEVKKWPPDEYPEDGVDLGEEADHNPLPTPEINLLEQSPDVPPRTGGGSTSSMSIPSVFLPQHIASEKPNRHLLQKRNSQEKSSAGLHLEFPQGPSCQNLPYPCPFCEKAYTSWGFRRRHIKGYHTSSPELPCKWCYRVLPSHQHWEEHVTRKHNLAMDDARNGLLILEEAHMVLQIAQPTRIDSLMLLIKNNKEKEGEEKKDAEKKDTQSSQPQKEKNNEGK
ncbi:LOW QUALITY PROTEIN: uncharacterized protein LOC135197522 [Macrobrachium nipponense]|uniref:LOW QUALITY PROTEIN: uncharacterized protein LOC135197522 n=1 Tax=Macrobrachium nipponense TaxID=159736 RepID=UPI0030C84890